MSKALVIKNVSFAANALDIVEIEDVVPCTGIVLSDSTKTIETLSAFTLTATLSPSGCTDAVYWTTSDATIATVADGVVTPLAGGTVTITATCGSYSATCAVTIRNFITPPFVQHYYLSRKNNEGVIETVNIGGSPTSETYGMSMITTGEGYYALDQDSKITPDHNYPVHIPQGATAVSIKLPAQNIKTAFSFCNSTVQSAYTAGSCKCLQYEGDPWDTSSGDRTITIPDIEGVDSFFVCFYRSAANGGIDDTVLSGITIEALYS